MIKMMKTGLAVHEPGFDQSINPLLIPLVAANVVSFLDKKNDLLNARRVCRQWYHLGTDEMLTQETIQTSITCDTKTINAFLTLMTPTQRLPIVRWTLVIPTFKFKIKAFLRLMEFIAPSAICICINFSAIGSNRRSDELDSLLFRIPNCKGSRIALPRLEKLEAFTNHHLIKDDMAKLIERMILGAGNLVSFGTNVQSGLQRIVSSLPQTLRKLRFGFPNGADLNDIPYASLIQSRFQLEEFLSTDNDRSRVPPEALVHFLASQKDSLLRVEISNLEGIHRNHIQVFPQVNEVKKLRTTVTCETTFEFLQHFPNVTELGLTLNPPGKVVNGNVTSILPNLPRHLSVRKVFIYSKHPIPMEEELISFQLLSHCFPRITHLSVHSFTNWTVGKLTELFTYFQAIEWLAIGLKGNDDTVVARGSNGLQSVLSGIGSGIGLFSIIRLRTLEIQATPQHYSQIFSNVTLRRVFMRMVGLKEIHFVKENDIPEACQPFLDPLRDLGVDFYCMKRRLWCTFP